MTTKTSKSEIMAYLRAHLSPERLEHVLGVREVALLYAARHGVDSGAAEYAALLHDSAKWMSVEDQFTACARFGIPLSEDDHRQPAVLHAYLGAAIAKTRFGMAEPICQAIRAHTTGWNPMGPLDLVVYVADYSEPGRSYPQAKEVRLLAEEDLVRAAFTTMTYKLQSLLERGRFIHPRTVDTRNALLARMGAAPT